MNLYDEFAPPLCHALGSLSSVLAKAEAHAAARKTDEGAYLGARLFPDMFALTRQVQIACDQVRRGAARLTGQEPASVPDTEASFADLRARIASTLAVAKALTPAAMEGADKRTYTFKAGPKDVSFEGAAYIRYWILPNFYFHMATAYGILRHNGVEIGKADFLGG
jgi:hypothetical protein